MLHTKPWSSLCWQEAIPSLSTRDLTTPIYLYGFRRPGTTRTTQESSLFEDPPHPINPQLTLEQNAHSVVNYDKPFPKGWTGLDALLDPYTYEYLNSTFQRNQEPPVSWEGYYSTDVLLEKAHGFLEDALADSKPFFLTIAPTGKSYDCGIMAADKDGSSTQ